MLTPKGQDFDKTAPMVRIWVSLILLDACSVQASDCELAFAFARRSEMILQAGQWMKSQAITVKPIDSTDEYQSQFLIARSALHNVHRFSEWFALVMKEVSPLDWSPKALEVVLRERLRAMGWEHVQEIHRIYHDVHSFSREVLGNHLPYIDRWAVNSVHGTYGHLIQWTYVAEALEARRPGSAREFFTYITSWHGPNGAAYWKRLFDLGPGARTLSDPGFVWALVTRAYPELELGYPYPYTWNDSR